MRLCAVQTRRYPLSVAHRFLQTFLTVWVWGLLKLTHYIWHSFGDCSLVARQLIEGFWSNGWKNEDVVWYRFEGKYQTLGEGGQVILVVGVLLVTPQKDAQRDLEIGARGDEMCLCRMKQGIRSEEEVAQECESYWHSRIITNRMGNNNTQGANREATTAKDLLVGFENKPLTLCYANSILQVLFHHPVFADIIESAEINTGLLLHLKELMGNMQKRRKMDSVSTSKLMEFIERESAIFERGRHQDSHQFYFWLMNKINEDIKGKSKQPTALEKQFFSKRVTRTICQSCGSVSQIIEEEVDLSLFIPGPNVSLNHCIENYSVPDDMIGGDKFKCNKCDQLVDAKKFSLIKSLPKFLSIHLRRFTYDEVKKGLTKLTWLVPFPFTLRMKTNYKQVECVTYKLVGVVAHLGQGQNYGHYMSYILIGKKWYCFNDEEIVEVEDYMLEGLWGYKGMTKCAYMLFYSQI